MVSHKSKCSIIKFHAKLVNSYTPMPGFSTSGGSGGRRHEMGLYSGAVGR
jgi:hypothetical protein